MKRLRWRHPYGVWSDTVEAVLRYDNSLDAQAHRRRRDSNAVVISYEVSSDENHDNSQLHTAWYAFYHRKGNGSFYAENRNLGRFETIEAAQDACNADYNGISLEDYKLESKPKRKGLTLEPKP